MRGQVPRLDPRLHDAVQVPLAFNRDLCRRQAGRTAARATEEERGARCSRGKVTLIRARLKRRTGGSATAAGDATNSGAT
jgi:hypothetical protein